MKPYYEDDRVILWHGDNRDVLKTMPTASVDACVTDPPYELAFMGRKWDASGIAYDEWLWAEVWRVLKPGGHLLAFGGTRTWHRLAVAIEDAGFEIRDSIAWMYGSGFPKSLDVSKAIDKAAGAERQMRVNERWAVRYPNGPGGNLSGDDRSEHFNQAKRIIGNPLMTSDPATPDAARWQGWGTALKPAFEPIVVARKPLLGTVAENVLTHGTGAINIDGSRIQYINDADRPTQEQWNRIGASGKAGANGFAGQFSQNMKDAYADGKIPVPPGRWPANVILDESQAAELDRQSGNDDDCGGASRFFYVPKANSNERPRAEDGTAHPTVKPVDLMRYLVKLVTPPGGTVLEPFAGSGATIEACLIEGFNCVAIELTDEYLPLIIQRITKPIEPVMF